VSFVIHWVKMPFLWTCSFQLHETTSKQFLHLCTVLRYRYGQSLAAAQSKVFSASYLQLGDKRWGALSARPVAWCSTLTVRWLLLIVTETADVDGWYSLVRERHFKCVGVVSVTRCRVKYCLYTKQSCTLHQRMWTLTWKLNIYWEYFIASLCLRCI
jgi:hypothetical protein